MTIPDLEPAAFITERLDGTKRSVMLIEKYDPRKPEFWANEEARAQHRVIPLYAARSAPEAGKAVDAPRVIACDEDNMPERIWAGDFDESGFGHCVAGMHGGLYAEYIRADLASVVPSGAEPVAWRYRDFADGWIYTTEINREYIELTGVAFEPLYAAPVPTQAVPAEDVAELIDRLNEKHAAWQKLCDRWIAKGKSDGMDIEDDFTALRKTTDGEAAAALARVTEERNAYIKACDDYERDLKRSEAEATALRKALAEARERINRYADTAAEHDLVARIDALEDKP